MLISMMLDFVHRWNRLQVSKIPEALNLKMLCSNHLPIYQLSICLTNLIEDLRKIKHFNVRKY